MVLLYIFINIHPFLFLFQHFKIPLSLTMAHLVVKFILAGICRSVLELCTKTERICLPWDLNIKKIAPTGLILIVIQCIVQPRQESKVCFLSKIIKTQTL